MTTVSGDSLRARLQRYFLISFAAISAASLVVVFEFAQQARSRDEAFYFTGLTQVLSDLARRSLEIFDYSDTQRMLSYVSHDESIIPAILTQEGDLLIRDYAQSRDLGLPDGSKAKMTCANVFQTRNPAKTERLFCSDIFGGAGNLGQPPAHLGVSLILLKDRPTIFPFRQSLWIFGSLILSLFALAWITRRYLARLVVTPLEDLRTWVLARTADPFSPVAKSGEPELEVEELSQLKAAFEGLLDAVQREARKRQETEKELAVQNLARQVAHDIRSPLAALEVASGDGAQLPEEKRILIRSAVGRIRDIAYNLIDATHGSTQAASGEETTILAPLIDSVVSEKRTQYAGKAELRIERMFEGQAVAAFSRIDPVAFKRLLSNLINNSLEALGERGVVTVVLAPKDGNVEVRVSDDGPGIPAVVLERLGERGNTFGKPGGSGLGLHHAKTNVESWGGKFEIEPESEKGTRVVISLPEAPAPEWFVSKLQLKPESTVVVLDDDTSVHQVWQSRFDSLRTSEHGIRVLHFTTPEDLRSWVRGNPDVASAALYLTDYELLGHKETGLNLVEELGLGEQAVLVTSRYEEKSLLADCLRLKVRMIPKGLAGSIPISVLPRAESPTVLLLDDDALVHMTWKMSAKSKGVRLAAFKDPDEFLTAVAPLSKDATIYLDSELGNGLRGENIAKELHARGFNNLYLTTGHAAESLPEMPWIKKVVDKTPPWS